MTIKKYSDVYEMFELGDPITDSFVRICPQRGGIVTKLRSNGSDLLYLDRESFINPSTNIRGGIPILFPICGQLQNSEYELYGVIYPMKNHGLARTMCWTVESYGANSSELYNGCPWLKVSIVSTNETKNSFPFDFKVTFTYILKNGALKILQEYTNTDINASRMPFYAGFHPYFAVNTKNINYTTAAAKCFDYNDAQEKPFYSPFDISCKPEAVLLNDKGNGEIDFYEFDALNKTVSIKYGSEFKYIMLWSAQGKPFMCVEPWMARTGELNTKEELTWLGAGESLTTWLEIYKK